MLITAHWTTPTILQLYAIVLNLFSNLSESKMRGYEEVDEALQ